jgi:hypothetical protein
LAAADFVGNVVDSENGFAPGTVYAVAFGEVRYEVPSEKDQCVN